MSPRARRLRNVLLVVVLAVAGAVFGVAAILESGILTPRLLAWANQRLEPTAGLRVSTSSVTLRPWTGLTLEDVRLTVAGDPAATPDPILTLGEIAAGYRFLGLLRGQPRVQSLRLVRPDLDLEALSRWNREQATARARAGVSPSGRATRLGIRIDDLEISEGRARGSGGLLVTRLHLHGALEGSGGDWSLMVDRGGARVRAERLDEEVELTGDVTLEAGVIGLDALHLSVAGGRVSFQGEVDPRAGATNRILTSGYAISLERIASWFGVSDPRLAGELQFQLLGTGTRDSLRVRGGLRGAAGDGNDRSFRIDATRHGEEISIESLNVHAGASRLELSGRFTTADPPRVDGVAVFSHLDPAVLLDDEDLAGIEGLRGTVRFAGTGTSRETFRGSLDLQLDGGSLFGFTPDSAELHATLDRGEVVLRDARLQRGGSSIAGVGSIDAANRVAAELTGTIADLGDLGEVAEGEGGGALRGQAAVSVRVTGPLAGPSLEAVLHFEEARVFGARAGTLDLTLESDELREGGAIAVEAVGRNVGYGGRVLPVGRATGSWRAGTATVAQFRLETVRRGSLELGGELSFAGGSDLTGSITRLDVVSPDGAMRWSNAGPVRIAKAGKALTFSGVDLRSRSGQVTADVSVLGSGRSTVTAAGSNVDLVTFSPFLLLPEPLEGTLDFDVSALIGADTLRADIGIDLREGSYGDDRMETARGRVRLREDRIILEEVALRSTFAEADVHGALGLREGTFREALADSARRDRVAEEMVFRDVHVDFRTPDADRMREVFPWFPSPGGQVRLAADLAGDSPSPAVELDLLVTNGRVGIAPMDTLTARGSYDGTDLQVTEARLTSGEGYLTARGRLPVTWSPFRPKPELTHGRELDLSFTAEALPVRALTAIADVFEMAEGAVYSEGRLAGPPDSLRLEGEFRGEEGRLTIPEFEDPLVGGHVDGWFDSEGVHFRAIEFSDGQGGRVTGSGLVFLPRLSFQGLDVQLLGRNFHYRSARGVSGVGDGEVHVDARPRSDGKLIPAFTGRFDVQRATLDKRIFLAAEQAAETVPQMPQGVLVPEEARRAPDAPAVLEEEPLLVFVDIRFVGTKNVWLKTEEMEVELAGDVTFHINEDYIGLSGETHTLRGRYAVLNTDFDVERAEVRFVDPSDMLASVMDAEATTRVLDEKVTFLVSGTVGLPLVTGSTESGMSEAEIYELLALRRKRAEAEPGTAEENFISDAFYESWGALLATRFGRELSREIGFDTFDVEVEGANRNVRVGKYLGSDVFVRYRERIGQSGNGDATALEVEALETPERQLLLEYRLSEILQLQGETGIIQEDPYVNVDLKAEWGY